MPDIVLIGCSRHNTQEASTTTTKKNPNDPCIGHEL